MAERTIPQLSEFRRAMLVNRALNRIDRNGPIPEYNPSLGPCWIWTGAFFEKTGYGLIKNAAFPSTLAHRGIYEALKGRIPDGLTLDHLCRVPRCVNPNHLEPVTMGVNVLRGTSPSARNAVKTHCPRGHALVGHNIYWSGGGRHCRKCALASGRRRRPRKSVEDNGILGEKNVNAKLNPAKVTEILLAYVPNTRCMTSLAHRFGVSQPVISGIISGKQWKHVPRPAGFTP